MVRLAYFDTRFSAAQSILGIAVGFRHSDIYTRAMRLIVRADLHQRGFRARRIAGTDRGDEIVLQPFPELIRLTALFAQQSALHLRVERLGFPERIARIELLLELHRACR